MRRTRFRKTLLPYASDSALTGLQIIFLFSIFHDSSLIKTVLFLFAVLLGVWGSVPLLRSLLSRNQIYPLSLAVFQRALPSVLLLAWGESHLLDCSYIPFNRLAVMVWLVYVSVGVFFGAVRASHRSRLLREANDAERLAEHLRLSLHNTIDAPSAAYSPSYSLLNRPASAEQEAVIAGRS